MTASVPESALQMRTLISSEGELQLSLASVEVTPPGENDVVIVRLDEVSAADNDAASIALMDQISQQLNQALAQDVFALYSDDVVRRASPQIDQRALQAVHVNFP